MDYIQIIIFSSALKLLFLNSYRSTDFEVHRNWLAITFSLPISKWYYEDTSIWTLDYPPFFAWFEYALSHLAYFFDKGMLIVTNLNYASKQTILFQRLSVIVGDLLLFASLKTYITQTLSKDNQKNESKLLLLGVLLNAGLLMVDHIHFQYNGFLFSFLILSITKLKKNEYLQSAFWFTVLLNLKHIYLYIAPAYFVYLLRNYCFKRNAKPLNKFKSIIGVDLFDLSIVNSIKLGFVVLSIFAISFGPFVYMGQISQLLSRLFPVKRGLSHAYWAANFWTVYNSLDKILVVSAGKLGISVARPTIGSLTGGLVAEQGFSVLPNIPPILTGALTLAAMTPALLKLWYRPYRPSLFLPCLTVCAYSSFLFGYHVHEKAIMMVVIPLMFLSIRSAIYARVYTILSITGHYALFPLLYEKQEMPIKVVILLAYSIGTQLLLDRIHRPSHCFGLSFVAWYEALYIYGLLPLFIYTSAGHRLMGLDKSYPFVPLLMTSLYCSFGVIWSWMVFYRHYLLECSEEDKKTT